MTTQVGVLGGVLTNNYLRGDLVYNPTWRPEQFQLEDVLTKFQSLPSISVRQGVANSSLTGGQGYLKCKCTTACRTARCVCYKANRVCNSRCHPKNGNCLNHDDCDRDRGTEDDEEEDDNVGAPSDEDSINSGIEQVAANVVAKEKPKRKRKPTQKAKEAAGEGTNQGSSKRSKQVGRTKKTNP